MNHPLYVCLEVTIFPIFAIEKYKLMDSKEILEILEELRVLINNKESQELIAEKFGLIQDVYRQIIPKLSVKVEVGGTGGRMNDVYPNFFEAGYLSGRTFHRHQGKMELSKVIGVVKGRLAKSRHQKETKNLFNPLNLNFEEKEAYKMSIANGKIKEVINQLAELYKKSGAIPNELFMLLSQLSEIEKKEFQNTVAPEILGREKNKIIKGLINYIDKI